MIEVQNVVLLAADMIGCRDNVDAYITDQGGQYDYDIVNHLLRCFHLVETELATDRLPIVCEETIYASNGKIDYSHAKKPVAFVIGVFSLSGNSEKYQVGPREVTVEREQEYIFKYGALPEEKNMGDESEYGGSITAATLAYGLAAEYCLAVGRYAEHAVWRKKFTEMLSNICRKHETKTWKGRDWV